MLKEGFPTIGPRWKVVCDICEAIVTKDITPAEYKKIKKGAAKIDLCPGCFAQRYPNEWEKICKRIIHRR